MNYPRKIAIYLRGFYRLFDHTYVKIFNMFETIYGAENIDWYVLCWETSTTNIDNIKHKFVGKNLIYCQLLDMSLYPIPESIEIKSHKFWKSYRPCYWRLSYLDQILNTKKCLIELESGIIYDTVIFARTDIIYKCSSIELESKQPIPFLINSQTGRLYNNIFNDISMCDLYFKCDSITADILSARFLDTFTSDVLSDSPHTMLAFYVNRNQLALERNSYIRPILIRPDTLDVIDKIDIDVDFEEQRWSEWNFKTVDYRLNLCATLNIDPVEYSLTFST